jgi:O-antigen ligase
MRFLLIALAGFLTLSTVFGIDPGPAPGLKIKNALLYMIVMTLALRVTLDRTYRIQLPAVPVIFAVLIGYAVLTYVVIVFALNYPPHYDWLTNGMNLKNSLFDQMMLFLVFFYGLRTNEDGVVVLKVLVACWVLSHLAAVMDAVGIMHVGDIRERPDGRVQGAVGESNQYGAFVAMSLPATAVLIMVTRGFWRLFWLGAAAVCAVALVMTVSRGAFVGTTVAAVTALYLFRRHITAGKVLAYAGGFVAIATLAVTAAAALGWGDLLLSRLLGGARMGGDLEGISSGRLQVWTTAIEVMWEHPITLLTGYGWAAYAAMPFRLATHNHYLAHWFNLGVIGLTCAVLLFVVPIRYARSAALRASPEVRPLLIGFVVASLAIATSVFFVDLYLPWLYYWSYAGVIMRLAVNANEGVPAWSAVPATAASSVARRRSDAHGWTAAQSR